MLTRVSDVVVTGAGGSIGSELVRQLLPSCARIVALDFSESNLFEALSSFSDNELKKILPVVGSAAENATWANLSNRGVTPECVYHAAAYKHVPLSQDNPESYFYNNYGSTREVLDYCATVGASFVLISTDKAVCPVNIMGMTKRLCEFLTKTRSGFPRAIVRFGNVLNSAGSVVPIFKRQIEAGGPLTITDRRASRFFMSIQEAVGIVLNASDLVSLECPILALDMGPPMSIYSMAINMIEQSGKRAVDFEPKADSQIQIVEIGLRSGEKLNEKLSYSTLKETDVFRVRECEESVRDFAALEIYLDEMLAKTSSPDWSRIDWSTGEFR